MHLLPFTISLQLYRMLWITATYMLMILSTCTNTERRRQQSSSCLFSMCERSQRRQRRQQRQRRRRRFIDYETVVLLPVVVLYLFVVVSSFPIKTTPPTKSSLLFFECDNPTWWCAIRNQCTTTPATCNRHVPRATLGDKDGNKDNNSNTIDDHTSSIRRSSNNNSDGGFKIRELREEDLGVVSTILADSFLIQDTDATSSFSVAGVWNSFTNYIEKMDVGLALKSRYETFKFADRSSDGNSLQQCFLVAYTSNNKSNTNHNNNKNDNETETIVGICEVDNRPPREESDPAPRPYISSLAVARKYRRNGVATALITKSEAMVRTRFLRTEAEPLQYLYLQVLADNVAAKDLYLQKCGYTLVSQKLNAKKETLLLLSKDLRIN